jgi:hypothetical protein
MGNVSSAICKLEHVKNISCFGNDDGMISFKLFPENKLIPPRTELTCLYQVIKINSVSNTIVKDLTEISDGQKIISCNKLSAGTYQLCIFTKFEDEEPLFVDSCNAIVSEPADLQVIIHNRCKHKQCRYIADVTVVGGVAPYKYYLNCKEIYADDTIRYHKCEKNVLKIVDVNGCVVKQTI